MPDDGDSVQRRTEAEQQQPADDTDAASVEVAFQYSGPIPHPQILAEYDRVLPGSAERIMAAFETEGEHRRDMDRSDSRLASRGQWMGFTLAVAALVLSLWLITHGHDVAGTVLGGTTSVALATAFVIGQRRAG